MAKLGQSRIHAARHRLRLDEVDPAVRDAMLAVVEASLSPEGYALARSLMRINGVLGDLVELPLLMNEFSYNVALYGTPSETEPDVIDDGPHRGVKVFKERIQWARELMTALPVDLRAGAVVFEQMQDPTMPEGRLHPGDERHLAGCFRDNRVLPYEGIPVTSMPAAATAVLDRIVEDSIAYLPAGPRAARLKEIRGQYPKTFLSWIGGWEGDEAFYFRIQSPVVILELDHHTVVRTPNGNDYGRALVRQAASRVE